MKNKNNKKILMILLAFLILINLGFMLAAEPAWPAYNVCCEKTKNGAWCQNTLDGNCDTSIDSVTSAKYRQTPTSCDATSFCKLGCCVDSDEGLCMENTPQKVCQVSTGTWVEDAKCNVPQCSLGCCILGDQASFVTLTRCKKLSSFYGLKTNFKKEIKDEVTCVMQAYSQDKGACVYETEEGKTCKFTTRAGCLDTEQSLSTNSSSNEGKQFFKDYLCSADELATECGPTTDTMCISGRDEVYFKDTCGNPANIYDANKIYSKDPAYWQKIVPKALSCRSSSGNINSQSCGNCDYLQGSICSKGKATYGEYYCKDLNCYKTENGKNYKNGESWCVYQGTVGFGQDSVGSRHFRHVCIHGEETIEPCADFRNEICLEEKVKGGGGGGFTEAACRINRWQDCIDQYRQKDCLNQDKRECFWLPGYYYTGTKGSHGSNSSLSTSSSMVNTSLGTGILTGNTSTGICLPWVPPGLKFWESSDAGKICSLGNSKQFIDFETNFFGTKKCIKNCEALDPEWVSKMNVVCSSLGDCGAKSNFAGKYTEDGVDWIYNGQRKTIESGVLENIQTSAQNTNGVNWQNQNKVNWNTK